MPAVTFRKRYRDAQRWSDALRHHRWLQQFGPAVRLPAVLAADARALTVDFERVEPARPVSAATLPLVAAAIGRLHARAVGVTAGADLLAPFPAGGLPQLPGFAGPRFHLLSSLLKAKAARGTLLTGDHVSVLSEVLPCRPACLYKDANLRNFLVTPAGEVVTLDFDDLTLAPAGYDLAKLLLSWALTTGRLSRTLLCACLGAYNHSLRAAPIRVHCPLGDLGLWLEVNYVLTARYLGRHGYRHDWPHQRERLALPPPGAIPAYGRASSRQRYAAKPRSAR